MNQAEPAQDASSGGPSAPDILIVDDDPGMIRALGKALRDLGHLRFSTNGADALRLINDSPPDLLLLDAQMPGLNGFEVLETLKASPALADLPVIMVTSHAEADFEQAGLDKGAADFIAKPIRPAIVQARVRTQLRLKQANDALKQMSATDRQNLAVAMTEPDTGSDLQAVKTRAVLDGVSLSRRESLGESLAVPFLQGGSDVSAVGFIAAGSKPASAITAK